MTVSSPDSFKQRGPPPESPPPCEAPPALLSQISATDQYFKRRTQQLEARLLTSAAARESRLSNEGTSLGCIGRSPTHPQENITLKRVGPEVFPSPFKEAAAAGSPVAEEFDQIFIKARVPLCGTKLRRGN